jgi:hypothetical protein
MQEPVLTPDGITYDLEMLEHHFKKVGLFDPITKYIISK